MSRINLVMGLRKRSRRFFIRKLRQNKMRKLEEEAWNWLEMEWNRKGKTSNVEVKKRELREDKKQRREKREKLKELLPGMSREFNSEGWWWRRRRRTENWNGDLMTSLKELPAATKLHSDSASASAILPLHSIVPILSFQFQTSTSGHSYLSPSLSLISFLLLSSSFCSPKLYLSFT